MAWTVYVLVSRVSKRTYVGIALDVRRRLAQHNGKLPGGAKATRAHRPWRVGKRFGPFEARGEAQRVEHAVKRLRGSDRLHVRPLAT
ncbi:MAG: GIY-YIG nuclease family protein [Planctomycetes bacterium]|nr:GIY-YIG nuclease family protein [Planctomycetota bacterium]